MKLGRKDLNILLVILVISLGGVAAWLYRLPHLVLYGGEDQAGVEDVFSSDENDSAMQMEATGADTTSAQPQEVDMLIASARPLEAAPGDAVKATSFQESDVRAMVENHPFSAEARKIIEGRLDETDSLSRAQILKYCEKLRTSYTTKDIDFLRQCYSDDALIIVGHVVKRGPSKVGFGDKVSYAVHTKQAYLDRVAKVFASNKSIRIQFSDFQIMRHPTIKGIYGVTLRQRYKSDRYGDDGYLFLLWDFRNPSEPQIHVRTWQPKDAISSDDDRIDMSDFNLE